MITHAEKHYTKLPKTWAYYCAQAEKEKGTARMIHSNAETVIFYNGEKRETFKKPLESYLPLVALSAVRTVAGEIKKTLSQNYQLSQYVETWARQYDRRKTCEVYSENIANGAPLVEIDLSAAYWTAAKNFGIISPQAEKAIAEIAPTLEKKYTEKKGTLPSAYIKKHYAKIAKRVRLIAIGVLSKRLQAVTNEGGFTTETTYFPHDADHRAPTPQAVTGKAFFAVARESPVFLESDKTDLFTDAPAENCARTFWEIQSENVPPVPPANPSRVFFAIAEKVSRDIDKIKKGLESSVFIKWVDALFVSPEVASEIQHRAAALGYETKKIEHRAINWENGLVRVDLTEKESQIERSENGAIVIHSSKYFTPRKGEKEKTLSQVIVDWVHSQKDSDILAYAEKYKNRVSKAYIRQTLKEFGISWGWVESLPNSAEFAKLLQEQPAAAVAAIRNLPKQERDTTPTAQTPPKEFLDVATVSILWHYAQKFNFVPNDVHSEFTGEENQIFYINQMLKSCKDIGVQVDNGIFANIPYFISQLAEAAAKAAADSAEKQFYFFNQNSL